MICHSFLRQLFTLSIYFHSGFSQDNEKEQGNNAQFMQVSIDARDITSNNSQPIKVINIKRKRVVVDNQFEKEPDYQEAPNLKQPKREVQLEEQSINSNTSAQEISKVQTVLNGSDFFDIVLPCEIIVYIFSKLSIPEIYKTGQVCKLWAALTDDRLLWKLLHQTVLCDYPKTEVTRETAKKHYLRMIVNTLSDLDQISFLIRKYQLNKGRPFSYCRYVLPTGDYYSNWKEIIEEKSAQDYQPYILLKTIGLSGGRYGYQQDLDLLITFIETLAKGGNKFAQTSKINNLTYGHDGYERNPHAAYNYIEELAMQGSKLGIITKINGLTYGWNGYDQHPEAAITYIEELIRKGHQFGIMTKMEGLKYGDYGYKEDPRVSKRYLHNNPTAVKEVLGISYQDYEQARKKIKPSTKSQPLNSSQAAFTSHLHRLLYNGSDYKRDLSPLKAWLEEEASKGNRGALYYKVQGIKYGIFGFDRDRETANYYILKYGITY